MEDAGDDERFDRALKGVEQLFRTPIVGRLRRAMRDHPEWGVENAWSRQQIISKKWLCEELTRHLAAYGTRSFLVLGSWYGVLPALLLEYARENTLEVIGIDIDPACAQVATFLNRHNREAHFYTGDMLELDYGSAATRVTDAAGQAQTIALRDTVVINTCCEHIKPYAQWLARIGKGRIVCLQSTNSTGPEDHVNPVSDLAEFKQLSPLSEFWFAGALPLGGGNERYMLLGKT